MASNIPSSSAITKDTTVIQLHSKTHFPIKLVSTNFVIWQRQVRSTLIGLDLLGYIDGTMVAPPMAISGSPNPCYSIWFRQDQSIVGALHDSCANVVQPLISTADTAHVAWISLHTAFASASYGRVVSLKSKLGNNPCGDRPMAEYLFDMRSIANELAIIQNPIFEEDLVSVSKEPKESLHHSPKGTDASLLPTVTGQEANTKCSGDVTSSKGFVGDLTPAEPNKQLVIYQTKAAPGFTLSTSQSEEFPPLPRKILSPSAPAFVPAIYSYAALFTQEEGSEAIADLEDDPFSNLHGQSLILSLNAVEDHAKDRDGPILYTHSDGEDFVFIDTKLKPMQIDLSRCSKHPSIFVRN
ncbi:unnamed protein product [Cuscuta campestris]|uniref:Uncharacterized protein n=1 Tax=Cuscuta campestris TaxID=132261 RepID=A0A484LAN2_9ASTE|nr:unnamed protein product [Cuscuta campestris]